MYLGCSHFILDLFSVSIDVESEEAILSEIKKLSETLNSIYFLRQYKQAARYLSFFEASGISVGKNRIQKYEF